MRYPLAPTRARGREGRLAKAMPKAAEGRTCLETDAGYPIPVSTSAGVHDAALLSREAAYRRTPALPTFRGRTVSDNAENGGEPGRSSALEVARRADETAPLEQAAKPAAHVSALDAPLTPFIFWRVRTGRAPAKRSKPIVHAFCTKVCRNKPKRKPLLNPLKPLQKFRKYLPALRLYSLNQLKTVEEVAVKRLLRASLKKKRVCHLRDELVPLPKQLNKNALSRKHVAREFRPDVKHA